MALIDKNIIITPNKGEVNDPQIVFSGADSGTGAQNITVKVTPANNGTLTFEGTSGTILTIDKTTLNFNGIVNGDSFRFPDGSVLSSAVSGSVGPAAYASQAASALNADNAKNSTLATQATSALNADNAKNATLATQATSALNSDKLGGNLANTYAPIDSPIFTTSATVSGTINAYEIHSNTTGFRFPDGTLQTTAASGSGGGGGSIACTNDTTTATAFYPMFSSSVTGTLSELKGSSTKLTFTPSSGTLYSTIFNSSSDERLKTNIEPIYDALGIVNQLQGKSFNWKETGVKSYGFIAQELELVLPELVTTATNGFRSVNYDSTIAILLESIKELNKRVKELESK